jgi:hypothetical protein
MSSTDTTRATAPARQVQDAYDRCLSARRQYIRMRHQTADRSVVSQLHSTLQSATLEYYESVRPLLSKAEGDAADYWEQAPLWQDLVREENGIKVGWVKGFKNLEDGFYRSQTTTKTVTGFMGEYEIERESPVLFSPGVLFRIGRLLDECLVELDLHVSVNDSKPPGFIGDLEEKREEA